MPASARPSTRPRTARERVAARRSTHRSSSAAIRSTRHNRPPRHGCGSRLLLLSLASGMVLVALLGFVLVRSFGTLDQIEQADPRNIGRSAVGGDTASEGSAARADGHLSAPFTVLLLGVDLRDDPNEGARSDTLVVVRVDPQNQWASMLSIPRDSITTIARSGGMRAKINYAYSWGYQNATELYGPTTTPMEGGGALAAETVAAFLGTPINYIAQVDFRGFEQIVDTLGGVMIDVPRPLLDAEYPTENFGVERIYIPAGLQRLDGYTALRYARSRHADSDFGRSKRQQQVLRALLDEVRRKGLLEQATTLPQLADALGRTVNTTLPVSDPRVLAELVALARELRGDRITQFTINVDDVAYTEDGSDIYWDEAGVRGQVAKLLAGPADAMTASETARVQVQNGAGVAGIAGQVSNYLQQQGFTLDVPADAPQAYEYTTLIDYGDHPQTRQRLAALLGVKEQHIVVEAQETASDENNIVVIVGADYRPEWVAN